MTMTLSRSRSLHAFTLIELLVVITIIGLLAGLAFPAIGNALKAAKKAEAGAMINQVRVALTAYQTEYGTWPDALTSTTGDKELTSESDYEALYRALIAYKDGSGNYTDDNPRGIVFMEFNNKVLRTKIPTTASETTQPPNSKDAKCFVDPWNQPYYFVADSNYDNEIDVPGDSGSDVTINAGLAMWSRGPQPTFNGEVDPKKNYIRSWK